MTAEEVVVVLTARMDKLERDIQQAANRFDAGTAKMKRSGGDLQRSLEANSANISNTFKSMAGSIAAYFSGRELAGIIDRFTRFQNSLRVAGVAAADLGQVQDRLFASAQKYGVELGALGGLYASLASASKELGVSQEQVFRLTDAVSAALKVSGSSAESASGALLQLGQALRGGKVQAEEYNSLLDGLYPLLEAAASGSERFGGSVATLTKLVKDGKVASTELFNAILAGSGQLEERASTATLSLSSAYTQLTNAMTVYVGQAAQTSGAQAALAQGITTVANNLDTLIPAIAVLGAALGVKYVASAGAAAVATLRADAALQGLTTRAEIAGFAIGTLGRALAINTAVLALTAAIGGFAAEAATTSSLIQHANTQFDEMRNRLQAAAGGAQSAGDGAREVGIGAANAEPKVRSFAGAVGNLADQLYRQAQAARAARVEMLQKRLEDSRGAETELGQRTPAGRNASAADFRRGDFLNNAGILARAATDSIRSLLSGGRTDREAVDAYRKQVAVSRDLERQIREAKAAPLESFVPLQAPPAPPAGSGSGRGRRAGGSSVQSADQRREEQQRIEQEIANAQIGYLQELAQTARSASDRADIEKKAIDATRRANELEINDNEALSSAQRDKLIEINNQVAGLRQQQLQDRENDRVRQQQLALTTQALRDEDDLLRLQSDLADTAADRRRIELRRVDIAYRVEEAAIAEELAQAQIAGDTARIAAARKRLADLEEKRGTDTENVKRNTESPGQRYLREVNRTAGQIGEDVEMVGARGLDALNDKLADAITGARSLGDVFKDVSNQIIHDLLRIAIQQTIIKPLANQLFGGEGGGGLGEIFGSVGKIFGGAGSTPPIAGARANGGPVLPGRVYEVGERGRELFAPGMAGAIIPNHAIQTFSPNQRVAAPVASRPTEIVLHVQANDFFDARVQSIAGPIATDTSVRVVQAAAPHIARQAAQAAPGAVARQNKLGTI